MRALVTGGTGFIGSRLLEQLTRPVVLTRSPEKSSREFKNVEFYRWVPDRELPPLKAFRDVDVVFHLAGEPIAGGRWTATRKKRILESRVLGTRNLVAALRALEKKPKLLISVSAIGYYGSRGEEILDESDAAGDDFLAEVCKAWEDESQLATEFGMRVVNPRFGLVLGPGGGVLQKMNLPFKLGLGARLGNGKQWMSWIHRDDLVSLLLHVTQREEIRGAMNVVSAAPVRNEEFTQTLADTLGRRAPFKIPSFVLKIVLGELSNLLLASQRVIPRVADKAAFEFRYQKLDVALQEIVKN